MVLHRSWVERALELPPIPERIISLTFYGMTQSQLRHRDTLMEDVETGRVFTHHYDVDKCSDAKQQIREIIEQIHYRDSTFPWEGPIAFNSLTVFPRNSSWFPGKYMTQTPDVDNLVKLIKDAAKGILWRDDSQVIYISSGKRWGTVKASKGGTILEVLFYPEHPIQKTRRIAYEEKKECLNARKEEAPKKKFRRLAKTRSDDQRNSHQENLVPA